MRKSIHKKYIETHKVEYTSEITCDVCGKVLNKFIEPCNDEIHLGYVDLFVVRSGSYYDDYYDCTSYATELDCCSAECASKAATKAINEANIADGDTIEVEKRKFPIANEDAMFFKVIVDRR